MNEIYYYSTDTLLRILLFVSGFLLGTLYVFFLKKDEVKLSAEDLEYVEKSVKSYHDLENKFAELEKATISTDNTINTKQESKVVALEKDEVIAPEKDEFVEHPQVEYKGSVRIEKAKVKPKLSFNKIAKK
jgi:hypothetical protein